ESDHYEIYVQPFPPSGPKWQISTTGGAYPVWRDDGAELFYISPDGSLMAVPINTTSRELSFGPATTLFSARAIIVANNSGFGTGYQGYAPTKDGRRFLVARAPEGRPTLGLTVITSDTAR